MKPFRARSEAQCVIRAMAVPRAPAGMECHKGPLVQLSSSEKSYKEKK